MATLHTRGAAPAVERLIDVFPAEEKDQVRSQLAGSLCAVLAQKLLPARQGGRVALYELLVNTPAVANLIREGKVHQLHRCDADRDAGRNVDLYPEFSAMCRCRRAIR